MNQQGLRNRANIQGIPGMAAIEQRFLRNLEENLEKIRNGEIEGQKPNDPDDTGYGGPFQEKPKKK